LGFSFCIEFEVFSTGEVFYQTIVGDPSLTTHVRSTEALDEVVTGILRVCVGGLRTYNLIDVP
jgi:hypothetical protein